MDGARGFCLESGDGSSLGETHAASQGAKDDSAFMLCTFEEARPFVELVGGDAGEMLAENERVDIMRTFVRLD